MQVDTEINLHSFLQLKIKQCHGKTALSSGVATNCTEKYILESPFLSLLKLLFSSVHDNSTFGYLSFGSLSVYQINRQAWEKLHVSVAIRKPYQ